MRTLDSWTKRASKGEKLSDVPRNSRNYHLAKVLLAMSGSDVSVLFSGTKCPRVGVLRDIQVLRTRSNRLLRIQRIR